MQPEAFLPSSPDYSFHKSERLCSKKAFEFLFTKGKTFFFHPLKIVYACEKHCGQNQVQVAFGASKRNFKKAVHRNRIKRLLREAYRHHKLKTQEGVIQYLMIIYISKETDNYKNIETSLTKALKEITAYIEKNI